MRIVTIVARILFGLAFTFAGGLGIYLDLFTSGPPPMPGLTDANAFQSVAYHSHFILLPAAAQLISGILLLINRYVSLALMLSAAVLANILVYHITMFPAGIIPGLILTICWILVALQQKATLLPLLQARQATS